MSEPAHRTDEPNLHPGQHDEGGEGGMATRELAAHQQAERAERDGDAAGAEDDGPDGDD
ncbi:hypothetical protein [Modestobacter marinus]|uniref:hypothetical protein n=1 Tax=Modestobacter marinus TaxID=477641 RepID=UPI001C949CCB|nr:hypothetical protein [Modestobacter marinus]